MLSPSKPECILYSSRKLFLKVKTEIDIEFGIDFSDIQQTEDKRYHGSSMLNRVKPKIIA
jgi:hypothetical protein